MSVQARMWKGIFCLLLSLSAAAVGYVGASGMSGASGYAMDKGASNVYTTNVKVVDKLSSRQSERSQSSSTGYYGAQKSSYSASSGSRSTAHSESASSQRSRSTGELTGRQYPNGVSVSSRTRTEYSSRTRQVDEGDTSRNRQPSYNVRQTTPIVPVNRRVIRPHTRRECTDCVVNGASYKGHSRFEYQDNCLHHRCICHCDGTADCPEGSITNMCERDNMENPNCGQCSVQDREIKGNSYFNMTEGCTSYTNCICRCNGQWECSDERSENICPMMKTTPPPDLSTCRSCFVHGSARAGNSRFTYTEDCFEYDCDCFCDGRWDCPTERAQNICDYEEENYLGCNECEVNGEYFEGNSKFKQTVGCKEYTCNCHCNGTYDCPDHFVKDSCPIETQPVIEPKECARCEISETESYPGESDFSLRKGCIHYDCRCNCDGSWKCPGKDARNLCKGERPGGCVNCEITETEYYRGGTNFTMQKGCIGYSCECKCNGSWNCPGEDARDTCKGEVVGGCKSCILSDGEYYPGNTDFEMKRGCILYQCRCNCDGGWKCPGYKAKDVCRNPDAESLGRREICTECEMSNGEKHQPNSQFKLERGCYEYECTCNCDGNYECSSEPTNICEVSPDSESEFKVREAEAYRRQRLREQEMMIEQQRRLAFERQRRREEAIRAATNRKKFGYRTEVGSSERYQTETIRQDRSQTDNGQESERSRAEILRREEEERRRRDEEERLRIERAQQERLQREREANERLRTERIREERLKRQRQAEEERLQMEREADRLRQQQQRREREREARGRSQQIQARLERIREIERSKEDRLRNEQLRSESTASYSQTTRSEGTRYITNQTDSSRRVPVKDPYNSRQPCLKCSFAGKTYDGNSAFEYKQGCFAYECSCDCNGRWQCDRDTVKNTCQTSQDSTATRTNEYRNTVSTENVDTRSSERDSTAEAFSQASGRMAVQIPAKTYPQYPAAASQNIGGTYKKYQTSQQSGYQYQSSSTSRGSAYPSASSSQETIKTSRVMYPSSASGYQTAQTMGGYVNPFMKPALQYASTHTMYRVPGGYILTPPYQSPSNVPTSTRYVLPVAHRFGSHHTSTSHSTSVHQVPSVPMYGSEYPPEVDSSVNIDSCQECLADGKTYNVNDYFDMNRNCVTYKCRCMCNGNYRCAVTPNPTCNDGTVEGQCGNCHVNGLVFPGNMGFQQRKGCYEYTCQCKCDGTYECPEEKKVNLCPSKQPTIPDPYTVQGDCGTCNIEGHSYTGNSQFKIYQKCFVFTCTCDCMGKWECSAEHASGCISANGAVTVGYPNFNTTGVCMKCRVDDHSYSPDTNFTLKQGCLSYGCRCNCDGSWYCPSQNPKQVCDAAEQQRKALSCQPCDVRGTVYPADATFVLREGCNQHTCTCNCDGTWRCPIKSTINVCKADSHNAGPSTTCKTCEVNGKSYVANTDFAFREGCTQYHCNCFCNGTWECPANKAENMCRSPDYRIDGCRECTVNNQTYPGGSTFNYREGCWEFNCMCSCDGKMNCPSHRSVDLCQSGDSVSSRCRPCMINSKVIKSESSFNVRQGCTEYLCSCDCNGNWTCPPERSINTCQLGGLFDSSTKTTKSSKVPSRGCTVGNKTHFSRIFGYTEDCVEYTCICFDNGGWRCPPNKSKRVC